MYFSGVGPDVGVDFFCLKTGPGAGVGANDIINMLFSCYLDIFLMRLHFWLFQAFLIFWLTDLLNLPLTSSTHTKKNGQNHSSVKIILWGSNLYSFSQTLSQMVIK